MRIIEIEYLGPPALGGVEAVVLALHGGMRARGHTVEVWSSDLASFDGAKHDATTAEIEGVAVKRFRTLKAKLWPFDPHHLIWRGLKKAIAQEARAGALFHLHSFPSFHALAALSALKTKNPVIITPHHDIESLRRYRKLLRGKWVISRLLTAARKYPQLRLAVHTRLTKAFWVEELGWPKEQIRVIPNGVYLSEFDDITAEEIEEAEKLWPTGEARVLFVGRLSRSKGVDLLLQALTKVKKASLLVMGPDEGALDELKKMARQKALEERIRFVPPPPRRQVCAAFRACDIFVLPSRYGENFGIAVIEAMAAGKPVIVSDRGGPPTLVKEGETGLIFQGESVESLSEALYRLTTSGEATKLREAMGAAGRRTAKSAYTWDHVIDEYLNLFESAFNAAKSP